MNLQYISDSKGQTTGVFIPIEEWNRLKEKYKDIEDEESTIPKWHQDVVSERMEKYNDQPDSSLDFNKSMDDIENDL